MKPAISMDSNEMIQLFSSIDAAEKGSINTETLKFMLQHYGEKLEKSEAEQFCRMMGAKEGNELEIKTIIKMINRMEKQK